MNTAVHIVSFVYVCIGPSKSLQGLVSKLRIQLTEKEKQLESLRKALQQVRNDLVETAQKTIEVHCMYTLHVLQ